MRNIEESVITNNLVEEIIDILDEVTFRELEDNSGKDMSTIFSILQEEAYKVVNLREFSKDSPSINLESLPTLQAGFEEYLRKKDLAYFTYSILPSFDLNWHCFGKSTQVRMFDGSIKNIEDIVVGDLVMGPDSKSRRVLKLFRGIKPLYKIESTSNVDSYICTEDHDVVFWDRNNIIRKIKPKDIPERKHSTKIPSKWHDTYSQRMVGYEGNSSFEIDPYYLGLWLGDGVSINTTIAAADKETVEFLEGYAERLDMVLHKTESIKYTIVKKRGSGVRNKLKQLLKKHNLLKNKHVPKELMSCDKETRLKLLAGFIDSDGSLNNNMFVCSNVNETLIKGMFDIAQSLGFRCSLRQKHYESKGWNSKPIWSLFISGNLYKIPTLIKRKQCTYINKSRDWSRCNIKKVTYLGEGEYFGFECDEDHLFLLKNGLIVSNCLEWFNLIQLYRLLCVIASRDHSKSFTFSFAHILWRLYRYTRPTAIVTPPDDIKFYREGMLITNEFKLAKRLLKKVKIEIEENEILHEALLPKSSDNAWKEEAIHCANGSELTLSSFHTSNRGPHPGWIVVDDFLDKSAIYSKEQRDKFKEVFFGEIMNMILPQGQVTTVGTPFHNQDLYADLKNDPSWKVFEYPAIFPDGSLLYEGRYNFEALKAKRISLGSMIFSREILVRPVSDSTSIFPWSILETSFVGMENFVMVQNRESYKCRLTRVGIGVDWAISANTGADFTEITVLGLDEFEQIHLLWIETLHGASHNQQIMTLQRLNNSFKAEIILVENNGFQQVMADLCRERGIMNVQTITTTSRNKKDLYEGLPSLAVYFEQGKFRFPRGNETSIDKTNALCSQLNSIAFDEDSGKLESISEHDDKAMSLKFAVEAVKYVSSGFRVGAVEV